VQWPKWKTWGINVKLIPISNFQRKISKASDKKLRNWHQHSVKFHLEEYRQAIEEEMLSRAKKDVDIEQQS
jgi:hypothetical protein